MAIDGATQRRILGHFATGVTVITTGAAGGSEWGMTANSITSLSLDPPLVLFAIDRSNQMLRQLAATPAFAINILRADQEALSRRFAMPGPKDFAGIAVTFADSGAPIFSDCLGYLDCTVHARHPGGDHEIVVGEIVGGGLAGGKPLLFYGGGYNRIAHAPPARTGRARLPSKRATTTSPRSDRARARAAPEYTRQADTVVARRVTRSGSGAARR